MAEQKGQNLADNLAAPTSGSEGATPAEGTTGEPPVPPAPEEDKFAEKSRDEILSSYKGLQDKYAQQTTELGQIRGWFQQIMPYFKLEHNAQSGQDELVLNQEVIKALGQSYGWFEPQKTDNEPTQKPAIQDGNNMNATFEENESKSIRDMIREELGKFREEAVSPIQQQFVAAQQATWIDQVAKKHPDFSAYKQKVGEFLNRSGMQVGSAEDLERAFIATKALSGGMVDKKQTEAHISELQKTLQTISPGAGQPRTPITEMSNEQLFGLQAPDTPQQRAFEQLTGVKKYRE